MGSATGDSTKSANKLTAMVIARRSDLVAIFVITSATLAAYSGAFDNEFLSNWDDDVYVTENPAVHGLSWENLVTVFSSYTLGNYAPVQFVSYMLDYSLWGLEPFGFILANILYHALAAVLVYLVLLRWGYSRIACVVGALLFALHPVQVDGVAWISQRKNVLCVLGFVASFLLYLHFVSLSGRHRWRFYAGSLGCMIFACLAKPAGVVLPVVLVAYDFFVRRDLKRDTLLAKIPYGVIAVVISVIAMFSQQPEHGGGREASYYGGSPAAAFLTMVTVMRRYLFNLAWPTELNAHYTLVAKTHFDSDVLLAAVVVIGVCAGVVGVARHRREAGFWVCFFFVGLLPVSQIVPFNQIMADRYLAISMVSVGALAAMFLEQTGGRLRVLALAFVGAALLCVAVLSFHRAQVWQSSVRLWQDSVEKAPGNVKAWYGLGNAHQNAQQYPAARAAYVRALEIDPTHPHVLYNLALLQVVDGQFSIAASTLRRLMLSHPDTADAPELFAHTQYYQGHHAVAFGLYQRLLESNPRKDTLLMGASRAATRLGNEPLAALLRQRVIETGTSLARFYFDCAGFESLGRDVTTAEDCLNEALEHGFADTEAFASSPDHEYLRSVLCGAHIDPTEKAKRAMCKAVEE